MNMPGGTGFLYPATGKLVYRTTAPNLLPGFNKNLLFALLKQSAA
jgi:hypothetical protein